MPEGPTLVILKQETLKFKDHIVQEVKGNARIDLTRIENKRVKDIRTWGKHFLICFNDFTVKIHFLLFGSYLIDSDKKSNIRLGFVFSNGTLNFYASQITIIEKPLDKIYDWSEDIMSSQWDAAAALKKLKEKGNLQICDNLMDQHIFAGLGNIIKNETLFLAGIHPESSTSEIPNNRLKKLVELIPDYAQNFLRWKKQNQLSKHWQVYHKETCPVCGNKITKQKTGKAGRMSFYCDRDQTKY